jgi:hypothetical protein
LNNLTLKNLPESMIATLITFLFIPFWSLNYWDPEILNFPLFFFIYLLAYWIVPLSLCFAIIKRHYIFLYLYAIEIGLLTPLITNESVNEGGLLGGYSPLIILGAILLTGFFILRKELLVCAINGQATYWRSESRTSITALVKIITDDGNINAALEDVSSSGIAIAAISEQIKKYLDNHDRLKPVKIRVAAEPLMTHLK